MSFWRNLKDALLCFKTHNRATIHVPFPQICMFSYSIWIWLWQYYTDYFNHAKDIIHLTWLLMTTMVVPRVQPQRVSRSRAGISDGHVQTVGVFWWSRDQCGICHVFISIQWVSARYPLSQFWFLCVCRRSSWWSGVNNWILCTYLLNIIHLLSIIHVISFIFIWL